MFHMTVVETLTEAFECVTEVCFFIRILVSVALSRLAPTGHLMRARRRASSSMTQMETSLLERYRNLSFFGQKFSKNGNAIIFNIYLF